MRWAYLLWAILLLLVLGGYFGWRAYQVHQAEQQFVETVSPALQEVARAYNRHLDVKKKPPAKVADLLPFLAKKEMSAEESRKLSFPDDRDLDVRLLTDAEPAIEVRYGVVRGASPEVNARTILAWCAASPRCVAVVMMNGSVEVLTKEELDAAIAKHE